VFTGEGVSCLADLLVDAAPHTCAEVLKLLPLAAVAHQAIYSGSETVMVLPEFVRIPPENGTVKVTRGDVGFIYFEAGAGYGIDRQFSEFCWFYDFDAEPNMWEGPVPVNVFARIREPAEEFYAVCRRIRRDGIKPVRFEVCEA
jgi:hypothetical protein